MRRRKLLAKIDQKLDRIESHVARIGNRVQRMADREAMQHGPIHPQTQRLLDKLDDLSSRSDP